MYCVGRHILIASNENNGISISREINEEEFYKHLRSVQKPGYPISIVKQNNQESVFSQTIASHTRLF